MFLLIGLGNPGKEYAGTRHNIGFMVADAIARAENFTTFRKRFQGEASEGQIGSERAVLLKPLTFMNDSGLSVAAAMKFFKIPIENIIVFHDELDLSPGKLRIKTGGGEAGHNGLRSITAHVGKDYKRVRIGIGHPGDKARVHSYVLSDFAKGETAWVETICDAIARNTKHLVNRDDAGLQNRVHLAMDAAGLGDSKTGV
jgi:PTH1 family peptidyl-tRNA hydrolase